MRSNDLAYTPIKLQPVHLGKRAVLCNVQRPSHLDPTVWVPYSLIENVEILTQQKVALGLEAVPKIQTWFVQKEQLDVYSTRVATQAHNRRANQN